MPRVSVIVPAHNAAAHIAEALGSVERQTFRDWEVVVVDDASSDDSVEVATRFRAQVLRSAANVGPAAARNLALTAATGELVALLDADDFWLPEFLAEHVGRYDERIAAGRRVGVVTADARILAPTGYLPGTYRDEHPLGTQPTIRRLLERNPIFVSSLAPRAVIDEAGGFDREIWGSEDFDLWLRIAERGYEIVVLREPLAVYRRHDTALTASQARAARSHVLAYARALERGNLSPRDARVARRQLRYSRAVEAVALAVEQGPERSRARRRLVRQLPLVLWVGLSHPRLWPLWMRGIRSRLRRRWSANLHTRTNSRLGSSAVPSADPYFESRFTEDPRRDEIWAHIVRYLAGWIPSEGSVLDVGAGYCSFINNVRASRRVAVDLYADLERYAAPAVETVRASATELRMFNDCEFDVVFASNLLEHLTRRDIDRALAEFHRLLKPKGRLLLVQPNYRLRPAEYFDDYTHVTPLSDRSLADLLKASGYEVLDVQPRFLPLTMKSRAGRFSSLVPLYLRLPVRPLAGQMLLVAGRSI